MLTDKKKFVLKYYPFITSLFVFIVYQFTIAPGVIQIDSGELASVQATLGIAHPTGYPLFTLIGYFFLKIPLPFTKIFQANLLAAIWCALGILFFIKSAKLILDESGRKKEGTKSKKTGSVPDSEKILNDSGNHLIPAASILCGSLTLAFSSTYWSQSTSVEVYSLQIFLFNLIIFSILKAYQSKEGKFINWLYVSAALALGFANHMTTLLVLPFITILFFHKEKFKKESFIKILLMLLLFFTLLAGFYAYLPLRAAANPQINWGNPINFENFFRHVSGKQYQVWLFASFEAAGKQLKYFLADFPSEFAYSGMIIGLLGLAAVFNKSRIIFSTLTTTLIFALLYSINYDIVDIDSYFLLVYILFSFFAVYGFYHILVIFENKLGVRNALITGTIISMAPLGLNFNHVDQSNVHTFEDYTKVILRSVEENSIVFSYQWDYFISPSYYFQYVEKYRTDVVVIDKELLRRSWYYNQLSINHPNLFDNMNDEVANFLRSVQPFERDEPFDSNVIEKYYRTVMTNLISSNAVTRNYYIGQELAQNEMQRGEFSLPEGLHIVPHLLLIKVVKGNEYVPAPDPDFVIRFPSVRNKYLDSIESLIYNMLLYRTYYELQFDKPDRAKIYVDKIKKDFPSRHIPIDIINKIMR